MYLPSHLESLREKHEYFEVPDLETTFTRHNNPHYWLQQDIVQIKQFQYRFFEHIILNEDTLPQIKIFSHFLLIFFRFNHQLIWEQQNQSAYVNFPQVLSETVLLPFIIENTNEHTKTLFHLVQPILNYKNSILDYSETSDNFPYIDPNFMSEPSPGEHNSQIIQHDTGLDISYSNQHEITNLFQDQETTHSNIIPDPSETATIKNTSESSQETTNDPQSVTDDSNTIQIPLDNIIQTNINESTSNNTTLNPHEILHLYYLHQINLQLENFNHKTIQPNYDPPHLPVQYSPRITSHNSPQQRSSNTQVTNTVQYQTVTPTTQSEVTTAAYTPAPKTQTQNIQPAITLNTLQSNPSHNYTTARHLTRPPLQTIPINPLSYSLNSTNPNNTHANN